MLSFSNILGVLSAVCVSLALTGSVTAAPADKAEATEQNEAPEEARPKPSRDRDVNTCLSCHLTLPDQKLRVVAEQYQKSVHQDERIGCVACHKGNPTDPTVEAHDPETGFVVHPPHDQITAICGGCHEDPTFVRRFRSRLPVDQRKLYELSVHGQLSMAGDPQAPTCADCHGTHDILSVSVPESRANRRRVQELCAKCHADKKHMAAYNIRTDQFAKWQDSVHGKAFAEGSDAAPTCTGCHSPHAGTLPGTITVAAFCGRCHEEERELFLRSPHSRAYRKLGLAECVPCHGDHDVAKARWLAGMGPDTACSKCHSRDDKPKQVSLQIGKLLDSVDRWEQQARARLEAARQEGLFIPEAAYALDKLHTGKLGMAATVHALDVRRLQDDADALEKLAQEARRHIDKAQEERRVERRGYFVALAVSLLLFVLLAAKAVLLVRRRSRSES